MNIGAKWIWLDKKIFPEYENCPISVFDKSRENHEFIVAEFKKSLKFDKSIKNVNVEISADVKFHLYINGKFTGLGPVCAGGDFGTVTPMGVHYSNSYSVSLDEDFLDIYVLVENTPTVQCDMSHGKNGLIASFDIAFADGTAETIVTDKTWLVRRDCRRYGIGKTDFTLKSGKWLPAGETGSALVPEKADIPMLHEEEILPEGFVPFTVLPGETKEAVYYFDKIYSGYYTVEIKNKASYIIIIRDFEIDESKQARHPEVITGDDKTDFRSLIMRSVGGMKVCVTNVGNVPLTVDKLAVSFCHYPIDKEGSFECSVQCFDKIYNMGKHALKICRQTIELDSPMHQENLGCSGDYYIASLMNYYTYGDTMLVRLDIVRIARFLEQQNGFMFHTTYSLIWIMMVYEYYMYSGDKSVLEEASEAIRLVLEKMKTGAGDNEIIYRPESYMFVDWLMVDGISMHHPPMALGQSVLNAFYAGALEKAVKIYNACGKTNLAKIYESRLQVLKKSFNEAFFDDEKGLYFDGLNDKYETASKWLPENTDKRYFSWHTNTLAVLYDIVPGDRQKEIMRRIISDTALIMPQPYFMHFVIEALYKAGLFEECAISQLMRWEEMSKIEKGLQEGWYDISGYGFDYSHVWAGTPTYQLPSKFSGIEILKPGFKEIRIKPKLYGLKYARISIPTPYGFIKISMDEDKTDISVPDEITVID